MIIGNGLSDEEMFVAAKKNLKLNPERFVTYFTNLFFIYLIIIIKTYIIIYLGTENGSLFMRRREKTIKCVLLREGSRGSDQTNRKFC